jgi:hypothetical protein
VVSVEEVANIAKREPSTGHYHTHHHHYWVRGSSLPSQPTGWLQRRRQRSSESPAPDNDQQQNPTTKFPPERNAQWYAELRVPNEPSRHRYIIGTPPSSVLDSDKAPHSKAVSARFIKAGKSDGTEEHTHIHIYFPTAAELLTAVRRNKERSPGSISTGEPAASDGRSQSPKLVSRVAEIEDKRSSGTIRPRTQNVFRRQRRHRRSFQDSGGAGEESAIAKKTD